MNSEETQPKKDYRSRRPVFTGPGAPPRVTWEEKREMERDGMRRKPRARFVLWVIAPLVLAGLCFVFLPLYSTISDRSPRTRSLAGAKQVHLGCRLYAGDNEGRYPTDRAQLVPQYIPSESVFVHFVEREGKSVRSGKEFRILAGLRDDSPHDLPLVVGPQEDDGKYIVVRVDGSGTFVSGEEFGRLLKRYRQWPRADPANEK